MAKIPLIADIKGLSHETAMPRRFRGALKNKSARCGVAAHYA